MNLCEVLPKEFKRSRVRNKESASPASIINVEHIVDGKGEDVVR